jgi:nicotinamide-nucleotide amidase
MKAEVIAVGTELLLGEITDTNSAYLASELPSLGIDLYYISQVGDNLDRLTEVLERAWRRSDLVLVTGGLGPTEDDLTREAIAKLMREEPQVDAALAQWIGDFFRSRGREMSPNNLKQATLIPSAVAITNERGTAPGWWVEKGGKILVAMPGPPRELHHVWESQVKPRLKARSTGAVIVSRTLKTWGLAESTLDQMIGDYLHSSNPTIGVYAKPDGIHLRITAKARDEAEARRLIIPVEEGVRTLLKDIIWGTDQETLELLIGNILKAKGLTLAVLEYGTGGIISSALADASGAGTNFHGGLVVGSPEMLVTYGVDAQTLEQHGPASPETAQAVARAALKEFQADVGVGIAADANGQDPGGRASISLFGAIADQSSAKSFQARYPASLNNKALMTVAALFNLRSFLLSKG